MQLLNYSPDVNVPGQMQAVMCVGSKYLVTSSQTLKHTHTHLSITLLKQAELKPCIWRTRNHNFVKDFVTEAGPNSFQDGRGATFNLFKQDWGLPPEKMH